MKIAKNGIWGGEDRTDEIRHDVRRAATGEVFTPGGGEEQSLGSVS